MALSFEDFKKNLKDGKYESLAGARRAVGKAISFSEDERESAKRAIDKHFGAEPQAEKTVKKGAKKAAKKAAAAAPKAEPKAEKKAAKKGATKRQPRTSSASAVEAFSTEILAGPVNLEDLSSISARMHIADKAIERATMALNSCSSIGVDKDSDEMKAQRSALSSAIALLKTVTDQAISATGKRQPKVVVQEEETEETNGASKSSLFAGSRPDANADA